MRILAVAIGCIVTPMLTMGQSLKENALGTESEARLVTIAAGLVPPPSAAESCSLEAASGPLALTQAAGRQHVGAISDWSGHHVLFPVSKGPRNHDSGILVWPINGS